MPRGAVGLGLALVIVCWAGPAGRARAQDADSILAAATKAWGQRDFAAVRSNCWKVIQSPGAAAEVQSYARLRLAQSWLAVGNPAAARKQYEQIATNLGYPPTFRFEAEECLKEINRAARGLPPRDVTASRTRIPPITKFQTEFFVGPAAGAASSGDDQNPGTRRQPFATLTRARAAVRALKAAGPLAGPVAVTLLPGQYPVTNMFELAAADSGTGAAPIVYRAAEPGTADLYGGARLDHFARTTDPEILNRLPLESRGKVWQCDLRAAGITNFGQLTERGCYLKPPPTLEVFFNDEPMTLARWPKTGFVDGGKVVSRGSKKENQPSVFKYLDPRPARWVHAEDPWLYGYFANGWADRTLKILKIDPQTQQIACGPFDLAGELMGPVPWFNKGHIRYFAFNLLEELGRPGEWYLDRRAGVLYFYPPSDPAKARVEIGQLTVPMWGLNQVTNVRLQGLVFDLGRDDCLALKDCDHCLVAGCTVKRFAGEGIAILGGHDDGILSCNLFSLGRGATEVVGGDRATLSPAGHFVENCFMHSFGRLDHTYVPGIHMEGAGIRAAHNSFADCPSSAIRFDGNDFLIEYNQVAYAVLESEDQGAIETWGNPSFRGNILRYNRIAFIGSGVHPAAAGRAGIRLDDVISGTIIYGNILYRASQSFGGVNMNSGRDNIIDNNIFVDCERGITGNYIGENSRWHLWGKEPTFIRSDLYLRRYPEMARIDQEPALNFAWRNVFWKCGPMFGTTGPPVAKTFDVLADIQFSNDPGFVNAAAGDFRLKRDADVFQQMAFHPIPVNEIGLYSDEYRKP
jgi:hypothetical protein